MSMLGKNQIYMSEKLTSVEQEVLSYRNGAVRSVPNVATTFIPHSFNKVTNVFITPIDASTIGVNNGVGLFTTVKGFQVMADVNGDFTDYAISDLPNWTNAVDYLKGCIVEATDGVAYECIANNTADNTATTGNEPGVSGNISTTYWTALTETKFLKVLHTATGSGASSFIRYKLEGIANSAA